jgi:hypothetical protein
MARDATTVQTEIDSLRSSLAKGILRVRHGESDITYQDAATMRGVLNDLIAELNSLSATPLKQVRFKTSKGLDL